MTAPKSHRKVFFFILAIILTTLACATLSPAADVVIENTPVALEVDTPTVPLEEPTENNSPEPTVQPSPENETNTPAPSEIISPPENLSELFAPFWEVYEIVDEEFVDQPVDPVMMLEGAAGGLLEVSELEETEVNLETARSFAEAADTPTNLIETSLPFWQTWVRATALKDEKLMRAAIDGMLISLGDQHTSYMDPDQFIQASIPLEGEYEGIGAWVDADGEFLTIVGPMPGSPAEGAGLKPGDQIIKIDGEDMTGIDGNLVIRRVLGPAGSQVILTIHREGIEDFDVEITRARIVIPSVTGEILEEYNIAHIQLFNFGQNTGAELRNLLEDLLKENPTGIILDLRNNGGGYLRTAIEIASQFIDEGIIMYEVYGNGERDTYDSYGDGLATDIPLVVIINEGSASASEILAGAIQDYGRAPLVGVTSFGKGSVQSWIQLISEQGAVRVTIARWYTPKERLIHEVGLAPDFVVENTEADIETQLDPQLDKAIEILLNP